jgi:hypothetical protein
MAESEVWTELRDGLCNSGRNLAQEAPEICPAIVASVQSSKNNLLKED